MKLLLVRIASSGFCGVKEPRIVGVLWVTIKHGHEAKVDGLPDGLLYGLVLLLTKTGDVFVVQATSVG